VAVSSPRAGASCTITRPITFAISPDGIPGGGQIGSRDATPMSGTSRAGRDHVLDI
jgi:hypothetical protein